MMRYLLFLELVVNKICVKPFDHKPLNMFHLNELISPFFKVIRCYMVDQDKFYRNEGARS